jgi:UDP-GlcNAc:undecaprenyl-phosphate GlcNAc-1-phosphate transferase
MSDASAGGLAAPVAGAIGAVVAFAVTSVVARALATRAQRLALVDPPSERKLQSRPMPLVGGLAIVAGVGVGAAVVLALDGWLVAARFRDSLSAGAAGVAMVATIPGWVGLPLCGLLLGLVDDRGGKRLSASMKAIATLCFLVADEWWRRSAAGGSRSSFLDSASWVVVAWFVLHATNTVDHVDGLCGSIVFVGAVAVTLLRAAGPWPRVGDAESEAVFSAPFVGALAAFLLLNFPRARVFLGDGGTLLLGGAFATWLLHERRPELLLFVAVPLADLASVAAIRVAVGARPWVGDRRHVTHRLVERGVAPARAVLALAALQAACTAVGAIAWRRGVEPVAGGWLAASVIGLLALGMLGVAPHARATDDAGRSAADERR